MKKLLSKLVGKEIAKKKAISASKSKTPFWHTVQIPDGYQDRFKGVSIGYDKRKNSKGYFVYTHRAKSKSYSSITKIPYSIIQRIEQAG